MHHSRVIVDMTQAGELAETLLVLHIVFRPDIEPHLLMEFREACTSGHCHPVEECEGMGVQRNVHATLFNIDLPNFSILSLYSRPMDALALDVKITEVHLRQCERMRTLLSRKWPYLIFPC